MKVFSIIILLILVFADRKAFAQSPDSVKTDFNVVVGKVTMPNGQAVVGALVRVKGKDSGTVTDARGNFSLFATSKDTLIINFVGYSSPHFSLKEAPIQSTNEGLVVSLNYKDITNVSSEHNSGMSINSFSFPPLGGYDINILPPTIFKNCQNLGDVSDLLLRALEIAGYSQRSFFLVPHGFALATQIETIKDDGTSVMNSDRFSVNEESSISFSDFFSPRKGSYRLFVFLVTDEDFKPNDKNANLQITNSWCRVGYPKFPTSLKTDLFSKNHYCAVLVYEFKSGRPNSLLTLRQPKFSAEEHLKYSNILKALDNP